LSDSDRKAKRKPIAEKLYKQGHTQQTIATQLGVSQYTISMDLQGLLVSNKPCTVPKTRGGGVKDASRPKGGRPKGSAPKRHYKEDDIVALAGDGMTIAGIAAETGIGQRQVRHVVERDRIRQEAAVEGAINATDLSMTAQKKNEIWRRHEAKRLYAELHQQFQEKHEQHVKEYILPHYNKLANDAERIIKARKGVFTAETFRKILACLHPDNVQGDVAKRRNEWAFRVFNENKVVLVGEKEMPTRDTGLPKTWQEWEAAKAKVAAERKAAYAARRAGKTGVAR
jgi:DNA-binding CsgD family transcriptional regulator